MENVTLHNSNYENKYNNEEKRNDNKGDTQVILSSSSSPTTTIVNASEVFSTVLQFMMQELLKRYSHCQIYVDTAFDVNTNDRLQESNYNVKQENKRHATRHKGQSKENKTITTNATTTMKENKGESENNSKLEATFIRVPHLDEFKLVVNKIINLPIIKEQCTKSEEQPSSTLNTSDNNKNNNDSNIIITAANVEDMVRFVREDPEVSFVPLLESNKKHSKRIYHLQSNKQDDVSDKISNDDNNDDIDADDDYNFTHTNNQMRRRSISNNNNNSGSTYKKSQTRKHAMDYNLYHHSFSVHKALHEECLLLHQVIEHVAIQGMILSKRIYDTIKIRKKKMEEEQQQKEQEEKEEEKSATNKKLSNESEQVLRQANQSLLQRNESVSVSSAT